MNPELVEVLDVDTLAIHEEHLRGLITEHVQHTGSSRGERSGELAGVLCEIRAGETEVQRC